MFSSRSSTLRAPLTVAALALLAAGAQAQYGGNTTSRKILTYTDTNQSIWGPNMPGSGLLNKILLGPKIPQYNESIGGIGEIVTPEINALPLFYIPSYSLGKTGVKLAFGGSGQFGFTVRPWYDSGSLDYKYFAGVDVTYPRLPVKNAMTTVSAKFVGCAGSTYSTSSPQLGAKFGFEAGISGYTTTEAWFLDQKLFGGDVFRFDEPVKETMFGDKDPNDPTGPGKIYKFDVPDDTNRLIGLINSTVNPIPIGMEIYRPVIETKSGLIKPDGTLEARSFGKFMSLQTDLAGWCFALIPGPAGKVLSNLVHGDYPVPGTEYNVGWDFFKSYANLDVGFIEKNSLGPSKTNPPKIRLVVKNAVTGRVIAESLPASGTVSLQFVMPEDGVIIEPELDLTLGFKNRFAMGVGGEVGSEPIRVFANGSLGYGTNIAPVDFDFSVGKVAWKPSASEGNVIFEREFDLRGSVEGKKRTLQAVGVKAFDGNELPREVYGRQNPSSPDPFPAYIQAYSYDFTTGSVSNDYKTISIAAEQSRSFFPANATFTATIQKAGETEVYPLQFDGNPRDFITSVGLKIPTLRLSPGQSTITLSVDTKNASGAPVKATYSIPVTAYNPRPISGPALYLRKDLDGRSQTNRIQLDDQDTWMYLNAQGILRSTQVVLDDGTVLENDFSELDEIALANQSESRSIGFKLSRGVKAQIAGAQHTIRLRAPSLIRGQDGELLPPFESDPIPIFVAAGAPRIDSILHDGATFTKLPMIDGDYALDFTGANFTKDTKVFAITPIGAPQELPTEFSKDGRLRVTIPQFMIRLAHRAQLTAYPLRAETPVVQVPADSGNNVAMTSGGTSATRTVNFMFPEPSINRVVEPGTENPVVTIRNKERTVRIYGDQLFAKRANGALTTTFMLDGVEIPASRITVPNPATSDTITVPYTDITLPAEAAAKIRTLTATNPGGLKGTFTISNENARPSIVSVAGSNRIKILASGPMGLTVKGGPIYSNTRLVLGASSFGGGYIDEGTLGVTISASAFGSIPGKTVQAKLRNATPGGGDSDPITVTLVEGNPATVSVTKGVLAYDRASNAWKQELTVTYNGTRTLDGDVNVVFQNLSAGTQLLNGNGTAGGFPVKRVSMAAGSTVKVVALFRKNGSNPITYNTAVILP